MQKQIKEIVQEELKEVESPMIVDEKNIKDYIYTIRGQKVMLDFDLARIFDYDTRDFNNQVKHNIERFPADFMFQITKEEWMEILMWKKSTSSWGGRRKLPFAFTENGIYMLTSVLKGPFAVEQSIALMRLFTLMKDYIVETNGLLMNSNSYIESKFSLYDKRFEVVEGKIDQIMDNFKDPSSYKHFLIMNKERVEADVAYKTIYGLAKYSLLIIDNYISEKTLELLKEVDPKVSITIVSDNVNKMPTSVVDDYSRDTGRNISIIPTKRPFHDRYIFIDYYHKSERLYHSGASIKDAGNGICTLVEIEEHELYRSLYDEVIS